MPIGAGSQFPIEAVRAAFPALALTDAGRCRIYLDNPAGTQVPAAVAEAVSRCLIETNANLGGYFATTQAAERVVAEAHTAMADFLNAFGPEEVIVGPNMTTLTYHISRTLGRRFNAGDEIVLTRMDHEGNVSPWLQLAEDRGLNVRFVDFDPETWCIDPAALGAVLSERTKLVALNYASNLTGSINPVRRLVSQAREAGAITYVDAVQYAPHGPIDVQALGCDFLVCSSYKFFGPHLGILWGRRALLDELIPYKLRCSSNALPERFELGTPQIELLSGLTAAVDHHAEVGRLCGGVGTRRQCIIHGFTHSIEHEAGLAAALVDGLSEIPGTVIHGITDRKKLTRRVPTVSFTVAGMEPDVIARALAADGIFVWSGHNYAWEIVHQLGIRADQGVVRIGAAHYNTMGEIAKTVSAVRRAVGAG